MAKFVCYGLNFRSYDT